MHVLLIGLGNMGKKYLRKIKELGLNPVICDIDPEKANVCNECPFYCHIGDIKEEVQKVIIAVDPKDHVRLAKEFLEKGIPVLLEKPPALTSKEFEEIVENPNLEISEIELYSEAVKNFPTDVEPEEIVIERLNKGSGYINPLWDLAWHDLYVLQYLFGDVEAEEVNRKNGIWEIKGKVKNVPFTLRVAWNYPEEQKRVWRIKTKKGEILMDFIKEELAYGNYKRQRLYGDKLGEMVRDFLSGVRREGSTRRALNNLRILESLKI
ncbi:Gfo/Idh/MocA family protein [Aquifex aeolicus]|uniref:Gfo/Idh/MocA-like oxidoreductase N-terminal domain-containing protein n=1 Tax=Aquifex aeolicus (strain VF5) TaxID=224324 RepID=O66751_AQUAE|nr:Gfo/Idh/MocA family oxidoreductase [Aquifex aeolicus]AAC06715.1 putative protein [Aquifex aeolicus VF5]